MLPRVEESNRTVETVGYYRLSPGDKEGGLSKIHVLVLSRVEEYFFHEDEPVSLKFDLFGESASTNWSAHLLDSVGDKEILSASMPNDMDRTLPEIGWTPIRRCRWHSG